MPSGEARDIVTPETLLRAYAYGIFPMADDRNDDTLFWVDPDERGIIPLDSFKISRSLKKAIRLDRYTITSDRAFRDVMRGCAVTKTGRETTWISERIESLYCALHARGAAHSIECWHEDNLVGGLYGVSIAGAFFGESMFHTMTDASKVALAHLIARLKAGSYRLLDTQFVTDHLKQFGAIEISREDYHQRLNIALNTPADYSAAGTDQLSGARVLQLITHTS